jgi:hypothetical protein
VPNETLRISFVLSDAVELAWADFLAEVRKIYKTSSNMQSKGGVLWERVTA